ncbi:MAG: hypothetical protein NWE83_07620 [Candidatus Bathyarchaeota archaeon]|nr:hypothetical protein [Candidatus Bathyarchaeota archaeon]
MNTYLMIWFNSEGAEPQEVVDKLRGIGFQPMRGPYDHVYEWTKDTDLEKILQLGTTVHQTLKGLKVLYKLETV